MPACTQHRELGPQKGYPANLQRSPAKCRVYEPIGNAWLGAGVIRRGKQSSPRLKLTKAL